VQIFTHARTEFSRVTSTRMGRVSLVALMTVPLFYGGLYLWGNEDPYANLDRVPAALVVSDTGATVDDEAVNYGQDAADELLDSNDFDWHEVSASEAATGVRNGTYDFALSFPASFSTDLSSASGSDPTQAQLVLTTNDANSYLSTTIAKQAAATVRTELAQQVGSKATATLLDSIAQIRDGIVDATDGAAHVADGASTAASGASDLAAGTAKLSTGAASLSTGAAKADAGAQKLSTGASKVSMGASQANDGAQKLSAGATSVASGADDLSAGLATLDAGTAALPASTTALADGAAQTEAGVKAIFAAYGVPDAVSGQVIDGLDQVSAGTAQLANAAPVLAAGAHSAATGAATLASGTESVATGAAQLAAKSPALASGAAQVAAGASELAAKTPDLASGAAQLASGASNAAAGAQKLADGTSDLSTGATKLSDALDDAQNDIPDQSASEQAAIADAVSDPVDVHQDAVTEAANYGAGLAPFFISLGAWIGIYALFLILRPLSRRALTASRRPLRTMLAGWATPAVLGAVQMIALFAIVTLALGLPLAHPVGTLAFMVFTSVTFAAILLALNAALGSVGQFLGLVLMVVQLVVAGGTFPWQTLPGPLAAVHQVLPMSHAVQAIRQLMYGEIGPQFWGDVMVLVFWLIGALALATFSAFKQSTSRSLREVRPAAIGG
jgi:putative membrane protein